MSAAGSCTTPAILGGIIAVLVIFNIVLAVIVICAGVAEVGGLCTSVHWTVSTLNLFSLSSSPIPDVKAHH